MPDPRETGDWRTDRHLLMEIIQRSFDRAVEAAIRDHHLHGQPVVIMDDDDRILLLHPDGTTTPVEDEEGPA